MIRIGINGIGRIGRAITRIALQRNDYQIAVINDVVDDLKNLAYLLNYDSIYGRLEECVQVDTKGKFFIYKNQEIPVYSFSKVEDVPWNRHSVDVVIEATGVRSNVFGAYDLIKQGIGKVIVTHSPNEVDHTIILGVSEHLYNPQKHHVISSSICDASAIAPILHGIESQWKIKNCFVTTLHPWLSYQNLLDGPVCSVSSPGHCWTDYSLGRSSVMSLIPKETTAATATLRVLPQLQGKLDAHSFRVPTNVVSASDIVVSIDKPTNVEEVNAYFKKRAEDRPDVFEFQEESLVSIDHRGTTKSCIIDGRYTKVLNDTMIKMIVWYDNEWGYSNKVLEIASFIHSQKAL